MNAYTSSFNDDVDKTQHSSSINKKVSFASMSTATTATTSDDALDSLVKNTQNDAKKFFKKINNKTPNYKLKTRLKPSKRGLVVATSSVIHTDGLSSLCEADSFISVANQTLWVPWLGGDASRFDFGDNIMWDIDGESTNLPVFCKMLIVHQGACLVNSPAILARDAGIQVGQDFISIPLSERTISTNTTTEIDAGTARKRRLSWTLNDEYYSIPQYQYRGKSSGKSEKEAQVTESSFLEQPKTHSPPESDEKVSITYSTKTISTSDIIDYIKISKLSKNELMSESALDTNPNVQKQTYSYKYDTAKRTRKVMHPDFRPDDTLNVKEVKRFEFACPVTGYSRLTILTPKPNANKVEIEQFEEYTVTDSAIDTSDLNRHVTFDNYTYIQLLSDKVNFEKRGLKKPISLTSSFRNKQSESGRTGLSRSKSTVEKSTLTEANLNDTANIYKRLESIEDDISDILKRYNIKGHGGDDPPAPRSQTPTNTERLEKNVLHLELNELTEMNDLFLDLNLAVSTPIHSERDAVSTKSNYFNNSNDYYTNNAKYPLISRAIHRSPESPTILINATLNNQIEIAANHTNDECKCYSINKRLKSYKPSSSVKASFEPNSTRRLSHVSHQECQYCVGTKPVQSKPASPCRSDKIVLIPALISRRESTNATQFLTTNELVSPKQAHKDTTTNHDYFQRGRYLRSSYDKTLLMYNSSQGLPKKTVDHATTRIDKLLHKFRSKLQNLKPAKAINNDDDALII